MWQSRSYTDTGQIRKVNEDSILDLGHQQLWLVADGMGGHAHGEYASQLVCRTLEDYTASPLNGLSKERLIDALNECNSELVDKAARENAGIIGCTVALLQARKSSVMCSWSGDSRIYRLRDEELKQLTRDHSQQTAVEDRDYLLYPKSLIESSPMLTNAIGGDEKLALEHCWYQLHNGDSFLLCTDGLNKEVSDEEIGRAMLESATGEQVLSTLARLYQDRGARDNVGMIWVRNDSLNTKVT